MDVRFPMPPGVVGSVLKAAADPDTTVNDISRLLETDAVLSAQLLKTVNSASFGLRNKVGTVDRAVSLMGIRAVRNLVMSLCIRDLVPTRTLSGFPVALFWEASLRRGAAARCIAERLEAVNVDEYFTLGLCQDLGVLCQLSDDEKHAERLVELARAPHQQRFAAEADLPESHAEIGFRMFDEWTFPDSLTNPVRFHHAPDEAPAEYRLGARIANAAEAVADLGTTDDKAAALEAATAALEALGIEQESILPLVNDVNLRSAEFAEMLGIDVENQPTYDEIVAIASEGLAVLNSSYELLNRQLQEALAQKQAMAAQLEEVNRDLDRQARTDSLTGLWNRRAFDEAMVRELAVAQRQKAPLSLLMLDIDHFKQLNDCHGHPGGDRVLARVGKILLEQARLSDIVARYGGEEFAVILPFTDADGARIAAERMCVAVASSAVAVGGKDVTFTASFGIATLASLDYVRKNTGREFVAAADAALYEAKRAGRNRVHHADDAAVACNEPA